MKLEDVVLGVEYEISECFLSNLKSGETVRATDIIESVVTHKPRYVRVMVSNKNSEMYGIFQTISPASLKPIEEN